MSSEKTPYFKSEYGVLICDVKEFTPTVPKIASNCDVLVVGGGNPDLYNYMFFTVGGHSTSDYGRTLDWSDPCFWQGLKELVGDYRFKVLMFDFGSEQWFIGSLTVEQISAAIEILVGLLVPNGFAMLRYTNAWISEALIGIGKMNSYGVIKFGNVRDISGYYDLSVIFCFDGFADSIELTDKSCIHSSCILGSLCWDIGPINADSRPALNKKYEWCNMYTSVDERSPIAFIRRRLIKTPLCYSSIYELEKYVSKIIDKIKDINIEKSTTNDEIFKYINEFKESYDNFIIKSLKTKLYEFEHELAELTTDLLDIKMLML